MSDWRTLLEQAEDDDERAEIIRVAMMTGVSKAEIDEVLTQKQRTTVEGPST